MAIDAVATILDDVQNVLPMHGDHISVAIDVDEDVSGGNIWPNQVIKQVNKHRIVFPIWMNPLYAPLSPLADVLHTMCT